MSAAPRYWALMVAAGRGTRMGAACAKQYLPLAGRPLIEYSLEQLLALPELAGLCLVLAGDDERGRALPQVANAKVRIVTGGAERADSVLAGLQALMAVADADDWVLVHDAARPCVRLEDIALLQAAVAEDDAGGILAVPVTDTLKQVGPDGVHIAATPDRSRLWRALTPQLFRLGELVRALQQALAAGAPITDEASALEWAGGAPRLVAGHSDNIKVTRPEDLPLAELYLRLQGRID